MLVYTEMCSDYSAEEDLQSWRSCQTNWKANNTVEKGPAEIGRWSDL